MNRKRMEQEKWRNGEKTAMKEGRRAQHTRRRGERGDKRGEGRGIKVWRWRGKRGGAQRRGRCGIRRSKRQGKG